jgi:hypothetical protein
MDYCRESHCLRLIRLLSIIAALVVGNPLQAQGNDFMSGAALVASEVVNTHRCVSNGSTSASLPNPALTCFTSNNSNLEQIQNANSQVQKISRAQLEGEEKDFFYDMTRDQIGQAHCELDLLGHFDQLPHVADAPKSMSLQDSIARSLQNAQDSDGIQLNKDAKDRQAEILNDIWTKVPDIDAMDRKVAAAKTAIPTDPTSASNTAGPDYFYRVQDYNNKKKTWMNLVAEREALVSSVWNGSDPLMQQYVDNISRMKKKGLSYEVRPRSRRYHSPGTFSPKSGDRADAAKRAQPNLRL